MRDVLGRMLALVSGATRTVARLRQTPLGLHLGRLLRPGNGNRPDDLPWAADNGAFAGFDAAGFERLLQRLQGAPGCRWVAAPDVVADAHATLALFREWAPRIRAQGFPVALVAQDGAAPSSVPWDDLDAVFIGGSTAWKTSPHARALVEAAQDRGKTTHMGRVNTLGRLAVAQAWGVDSVDGTNFSRFAEVKLPRFLGEIDRLTRQQQLW